VYLPSRDVRRRAGLACLSVALIALTCAGLIAAAVLVPAPSAVLPLVILVCVAGPIAATFELARAIAVLREPAAELRRELDRLPETPHPLGY
jgi:hypothetical protein